LRLPPVGIDPSVTLFLLPKSAHCHNTAGPREYIVIFGSPTGTQGFSGRYKRVEIHKFLIADQIDSYDVESDETAPMTLCPGERTCLENGHARGLTIHPGSWHIEYGRGAVVTPANGPNAQVSGNAEPGRPRVWGCGTPTRCVA
jgi:hypothetical protein